MCDRTVPSAKSGCGSEREFVAMLQRIGWRRRGGPDPGDEPWDEWDDAICPQCIQDGKD